MLPNPIIAYILKKRVQSNATQPMNYQFRLIQLQWPPFPTSWLTQNTNPYSSQTPQISPPTSPPLHQRHA
ncbi:hypothetical protein KSS87_016213 [Heliosperma pusillum]|nr:hypothetical protein KSS87_016213 [Heliosperma pusillum]